MKRYLSVTKFKLMNLIEEMLEEFCLFDKVTLNCTLMLIGIGFVILLSISPAISARVGVNKYHFILKQAIFIPISLFLIYYVARQNIETIIKHSHLFVLFFTFLLLLVLIIGIDIKGSKRWINIGFFAIQPSEILKPFFIILNAKILGQINNENFKEKVLKILFLVFLISALLISEPDFGMMFIYGSTFLVQMFVSGISIYFLGNLIIVLFLFSIISFIILPHVKYRIMNFLFSDNININYQIKKSIQSIQDGGFFGKGPGNGVVKYQLPDSHTDYIFAVICEEFGYIMATFIILLYCTIIFRNIKKVHNFTIDITKIILMYGIIFMFSMQVFINIGVNINILPSKGMTLPFISYGGSAIIGMSIMIGILLSLTKEDNKMKSPYYKIISPF